jgi:hypothetical protein
LISGIEKGLGAQRVYYNGVTRWPVIRPGRGVRGTGMAKLSIPGELA